MWRDRAPLPTSLNRRVISVNCSKSPSKKGGTDIQMKNEQSKPSMLSRRGFVSSCVNTSRALAAASKPLWGLSAIQAERIIKSSPQAMKCSLDQDCLFGGKGSDARFEEHQFAGITLPHCVIPLSRHEWNQEFSESLRHTYS
jgi:hypothetical protein